MKIILVVCVLLFGAVFISRPVLSQNGKGTPQGDSESAANDSRKLTGQSDAKEPKQNETEEERKERLRKAFQKGMLDGVHDGMFNTHVKRMKKRDFPISIAIPEGAKLLPKDLAIPKGTRLAVCVSQNWIEVASVRENADGSVSVVRETLYGSINCKVPRTELVIEDATIEAIGHAAANARTVAGEDSSGISDMLELKNSFRIWTDITGKHKVNAKLATLTDSELTLVSDDDRTITLPLEKLSPVDQKLLSQLKPE